jgi:hypothetical protein
MVGEGPCANKNVGVGPALLTPRHIKRKLHVSFLLMLPFLYYAVCNVTWNAFALLSIRPLAPALVWIVQWCYTKHYMLGPAILGAYGSV